SADTMPPSQTSTAPDVLRIESLHKSYGAVEVLRGIDLSVAQGERIVVIGASGSGKSTLLRSINFLEMPTAGRIYFEGKLVGEPQPGKPDRIIYKEKALNALRAQVGMVFQHFNLFPHMTVEQNVMLAPMKVRGLGEAEARHTALQNLDRVGIAAYAKSY